MEPLLFRYRLEVERIKLAPHYARTASDALFPVIYRLGIRGFIKGMGKELATPDALPAVGAFVIILHHAVVRSLDRFRQIAHAPPLQYRAAATAAVTSSNKLRFLSSHGESIEPFDNHVSHGIEFFPALDRLLPG